MPVLLAVALAAATTAGCTKKPAPGAVDAAAVHPPGRGPVIDSHTLITPVPAAIDQSLRIFEKVGIVKFCNKNGGPLGSRRFLATLQIKKRLGAKFEFFANVRWYGVNEPGWAEREAERLDREVRLGAKGVKIFKALGLAVRDASGKLMAVDDPRMDPLMRKAAETNAIMAMHTSDPKAFFEPVTPENERYDELKEAPDWSFHGEDYPSRNELLAARDRLIARHPKTTFLLIHLANNPEDIDYVARLLDKFPNVYVDTTARVPEFGRHPADKVRELFIRFQDRIMFGTDIAVTPRGMQLGSVSEEPPTEEDAVAFYRAHYRYFETNDKQIDHPTPIQGRWKVDAIGLPKAVLRKLYYDNAARLIFTRTMNVPVIDPFAEAAVMPTGRPVTRPAPPPPAVKAPSLPGAPHKTPSMPSAPARVAP